MSTKTKINIPICEIVGCDNMATQILDHKFNICERCNKERIRKLNKKGKKEREEHKMNKIIETYLDLADTVQRAGGCVSLIKDHRDEPDNATKACTKINCPLKIKKVCRDCYYWTGKGGIENAYKCHTKNCPAKIRDKKE